jgi:hypothetical protein
VNGKGTGSQTLLERFVLWIRAKGFSLCVCVSLSLRVFFLSLEVCLRVRVFHQNPWGRWGRDLDLKIRI